MSDWQIEEEWGSERVDILIMEAGVSVSPCFSAAGTSCHDLHEVITSVAMIRYHQGLRSYGQRRHEREGRGGGCWGNDDKVMKWWKEQLKETLDLFPVSRFFTYIFVFSITDLDLLWSVKSWWISDISEVSDMKNGRQSSSSSRKSSSLWVEWTGLLTGMEMANLTSLFFGCSLYKLKLDGAPTTRGF